MTKQEQIEEMASLMAECHTTCDECFKRLERNMTMKIKEREKHCQAYMFAKTAVEQGYRKLPKDSVVLTKEKYEVLKVKAKEKHWLGTCMAVWENAKIDARKETAKEILILLGKGFDETKMTEFKNLPWYKSFCKELKHRYDIEVEE